MREEVVGESDDVLCRKSCIFHDIDCLLNKTTSVAYQFLALPTIREVIHPSVLLNITAKGFVLVPQLSLHILHGNELALFDTIVDGESVAFRLVKPLLGPAIHHVMLRMENRNYVGNALISAHNSHVTIDVSHYDF